MVTKYQEFVPTVRGHLVQYPLLYLSKEDLKMGMSNVENYMPEKSFT